MRNFFNHKVTQTFEKTNSPVQVIFSRLIVEISPEQVIDKPGFSHDLCLVILLGPSGRGRRKLEFIIKP
jgi:hypothetical protein